MKRRIMIIATMAILVSLISLGTLAYFTDSDEATNVMTAGNVQIDLHDEDGAGNDFPAAGVDGVMPGDEVPKVVYVENTGDNAAFIRVKLDKKIVVDGTEVDWDDELIELDINTNDWELIGDYYYYKHALEAGDTTSDLFTTVTYSTDLDNDFQGAVVTIDVSAQAVQVANNGTYSTATGWPE